jgi:ornithine cyclodeaminase/alanine dehydrogenase-like protein (mu-crystallin family)
MSKAAKSKLAKSKLRSATKTLSKIPAKAAGKPHSAKAGSTREVSNEAKRATTHKPKSSRPLYLTEEEVCRLVTVEDAIGTLEDLFAAWSDAATVNLPRQRAHAGTAAFNLMGAAWGAKGLFGLKAYHIGPQSGCSHALLYSADNSRLLAMIESENLGQMRTGAASGLATKLLAKPDARMLGVIGAGRQAFTQIAAVCAVRPIAEVHVFCPTAAHREDFSRRIERELDVPARPVASAEAAVVDADVLVIITKSAEPVMRANWLKSGVHVNAAGANAASRREIDGETVLRATVRATDHVAQAQLEAAEYRDLIGAGRLKWQDITELGDIVTGKVLGRRGPADITLFKSLGIALEDIAFAELILRRAIERGIGRPL